MENKINDVIVLNISTEDDTLTSPETATEDLLCGDNDQFISCEQLLLLIKRSDRYLTMTSGIENIMNRVIYILRDTLTFQKQ